jgi:hypothetical protein
MDYYFSNPTHFLAGWVGFGAGLWVGPNKSIQDYAVLDIFKRQHGPVQEVIQRQLGDNNYVIIPLIRFRLGGGI